MWRIYNKNGIALVTSLMFTVLSLVITMTLLYMVTAGIKTSGAMKRYKTVTEAAYAGADIVMKDILTKGLTDALALSMSISIETSAETTSRNATFKTGLLTYMTNLSSPDVSDCLRTKLTTYYNEKSKKWTTACADNSLNLNANSYDFKLNLTSQSGSPYVVYTKIVDTMQHRMMTFPSRSTATGLVVTPTVMSMAGNTEPSSLGLSGDSTSEKGPDYNPHVPYVYRIEVQAERQQNPSEKSKLSLQYIY